MFGIDSSGFIIIMVVALIVIGPERLPEIMVKVGKFMAQLRGMTHEVKRSFEIEFERADLEKRKAQAMKELFPEEEPAKAEVQASAETELAVEAAEMAEAPGPPDEIDAGFAAVAAKAAAARDGQAPPGEPAGTAAAATDQAPAAGPEAAAVPQPEPAAAAPQTELATAAPAQDQPAKEGA
jgi:sec-independent protein translocase protein TatB